MYIPYDLLMIFTHMTFVMWSSQREKHWRSAAIIFYHIVFKDKYSLVYSW